MFCSALIANAQVDVLRYFQTHYGLTYPPATYPGAVNWGLNNFIDPSIQVGTTIGSYNIISSGGYGSQLFGYNNISSNLYGFDIGWGNTNLGQFSMGFGINNTDAGFNYAYEFGRGVIASTNNTAFFGSLAYPVSINVSSNVTAVSFYGDGSHLSGIGTNGGTSTFSTQFNSSGGVTNIVSMSASLLTGTITTNRLPVYLPDWSVFPTNAIAASSISSGVLATNRLPGALADWSIVPTNSISMGSSGINSVSWNNTIGGINLTNLNIVSGTNITGGTSSNHGIVTVTLNVTPPDASTLTGTLNYAQLPSAVLTNGSAIYTTNEVNTPGTFTNSITASVTTNTYYLRGTNQAIAMTNLTPNATYIFIVATYTGTGNYLTNLNSVFGFPGFGNFTNSVTLGAAGTSSNILTVTVSPAGTNYNAWP